MRATPLASGSLFSNRYYTTFAWIMNVVDKTLRLCSGGCGLPAVHGILAKTLYFVCRELAWPYQPGVE